VQLFFWTGKQRARCQPAGAGKGNAMPVKSPPARKKIDHPRIQSITFRLRRKRGRKIIDLIDRIYGKKHRVDIVDVGGTREYWKIIPMEYFRRKNVHITLVNVSPAENPPNAQDDLFSYMQGDGCGLKDIADHQFDIAHSNSVIEHVGDWGKMVEFAGEIRRIARAYYVQTPNYFFPIEPHFLFPFFHWMPLSVRLRLIMRLQLGCFPKAASEEEARGYIELCRLLTKRQLLNLFPDAVLQKERMLFFVKSFVLIRDNIICNQ
jgi:hypothetical protein